MKVVRAHYNLIQIILITPGGWLQFEEDDDEKELFEFASVPNGETSDVYTANQLSSVWSSVVSCEGHHISDTQLCLNSNPARPELSNAGVR